MEDGAAPGLTGPAPERGEAAVDGDQRHPEQGQGRTPEDQALQHIGPHHRPDAAHAGVEERRGPTDDDRAPHGEPRDERYGRRRDEEAGARRQRAPAQKAQRRRAPRARAKAPLEEGVEGDDAQRVVAGEDEAGETELCGERAEPEFQKEPIAPNRGVGHTQKRGCRNLGGHQREEHRPGRERASAHEPFAAGTLWGAGRPAFAAGAPGAKPDGQRRRRKGREHDEVECAHNGGLVAAGRMALLGGGVLEARLASLDVGLDRFDLVLAAEEGALQAFLELEPLGGRAHPTLVEQALGGANGVG